MTFRRDGRGLEALRWWRDRCLEWCYFRVEDGKMGDQKYLDDWPERFEGVHVLEHPGGGSRRGTSSSTARARDDGRILVDQRELVFYHFHSLRLYQGAEFGAALGGLAEVYRFTDGRVRFMWTTNYPIGSVERELVWNPYLRELGQAMQDVPGERRWDGRPGRSPEARGSPLGRPPALGRPRRGSQARAAGPHRQLEGGRRRPADARAGA